MPKRNSISPKPDSKRNLSFVNDNTALKKPMNSKPCEMTISVNKRRNDGAKVEILELKQKKRVEMEEGKEYSILNNSNLGQNLICLVFFLGEIFIIF